MRIYFLRHALAEPRTLHIDDSKRRLTPEGIKKTENAVRSFARWDVKPQLIYSSSYIRAKQTADIISKHLKIPLEESELLTPGFNYEKLGQLFEGNNDRDMMVVGHEPDFSTTISDLIGGGNITVKKGGLARIDILTLEPLHGSLIWLLAPKTM